MTQEIRLATPGERKVFEDYYNYTSLSWEAIRLEEDGPAIVVGTIDDSESDILLSFAPYPDQSDEAVLNLLKILDEAHQETLWVQGGVALIDEAIEYEDLRNEEITEDA
jgi:hypothetical protein